MLLFLNFKNDVCKLMFNDTKVIEDSKSIAKGGIAGHWGAIWKRSMQKPALLITVGNDFLFSLMESDANHSKTDSANMWGRIYFWNNCEENVLSYPYFFFLKDELHLQMLNFVLPCLIIGKSVLFLRIFLTGVIEE